MSGNEEPSLVEERAPDSVSIGPDTHGAAGLFSVKGKEFEALAWEQEDELIVYYEAAMEAEYPKHQAKVQGLNAIKNALAGQTGKRVIFRAQ